MVKNLPEPGRGCPGGCGFFSAGTAGLALPKD